MVIGVHVVQLRGNRGRYLQVITHFLNHPITPRIVLVIVTFKLQFLEKIASLFRLRSTGKKSKVEINRSSDSIPVIRRYVDLT